MYSAVLPFLFRKQTSMSVKTMMTMLQVEPSLCVVSDAFANVFADYTRVTNQNGRRDWICFFLFFSFLRVLSFLRVRVKWTRTEDGNGATTIFGLLLLFFFRKHFSTWKFRLNKRTCDFGEQTVEKKCVCGLDNSALQMYSLCWLK